MLLAQGQARLRICSEEKVKTELPFAPSWNRAGVLMRINTLLRSKSCGAALLRPRSLFRTAPLVAGTTGRS